MAKRKQYPFHWEILLGTALVWKEKGMLTVENNLGSSTGSKKDGSDLSLQPLKGGCRGTKGNNKTDTTAKRLALQ